MSGEVTIDLSNYKDRFGVRVPPGRYRVVVDDVEEATASTGSQMINLWLRVVDGDMRDAVVIDRLVLHPNALFRVVGFMRALGLPTPKKRFKINIRSFVGRTLDVDLDDGEPYAGTVRSEVRGYLRIEKQDGDGSDDSVTDLLDSGPLAESESADESEVDLDTLSL